ncbi:MULTISPECIES: hypothetical protein [Enterobacteriaceae]|jgi:hypothetical protein|uniref:hypothetical protein n=1 Tax=Enterobacteriaceae TaxID=543 RepID=UPI000663623F|nr:MULTISPECIES: hypothetical protein [Enterobacteriaceae]EFP9642094.1 hypothetical protein [Shigella boydii]HBN4651374.1 hypothetical protein [Escherichia coli O25b:H4-ST131]EEQ7308774.1 hypothetical protein [Escherichia coli]EET1641612.1 hypothetical protein [Escherichia coli]EEX8540469.1 hypothetical protein [Escherichia coli]
MSNKIENPVVLIHKRENHDSYAVAITNGSHDFYDGLLMASVSPDEADNSFAVFAMVGYYMAAEIEKLRAQRDALAAENAALKESERAFDAMCAEEHGDNWVSELTETPATDAFLAEVRAQGVDMARNAMIDFVDGEVGPNKNVPGLIRGAEICVSIAEQLRKGVIQ